MSPALKQSLDRATAWFNERPIRERVLLTATAIVVVGFLVWELAVAPVLASNNLLTTQSRSLAQQQESLLEQQQTLNDRLSSDPSQQLRDQLSSRRARLDRLDAELADTTGKLIAPRAMVRLLQEILAAQDELELVTVELLAPTPIFDQRPEQTGDAEEADAETVSEPLLYAHDVELVIRGGYLDVVDYINALEGMDDRLGWVSLDYRMLEYPDNEIRIRVRTLSLDQAWLGV